MENATLIGKMRNPYKNILPKGKGNQTTWNSWPSMEL
jgi:hypothetical protein